VASIDGDFNVATLSVTLAIICDKSEGADFQGLSVGNDTLASGMTVVHGVGDFAPLASAAVIGPIQVDPGRNRGCENH